MKKLLILPLLLLLVSACGLTPQEKVYAAGVGYQTAGPPFLTYANLPRCSATRPQPCSDQAVIDEVKRADNVVYVALEQAKAVVVDPTKTESVAAAAASAVEYALSVFTSVLAQYNIGSK